jgi:hypothetical protein
MRLAWVRWGFRFGGKRARRRARLVGVRGEGGRGGVVVVDDDDVDDDDDDDDDGVVDGGVDGVDWVGFRSLDGGVDGEVSVRFQGTGESLRLTWRR